MCLPSSPRSPLPPPKHKPLGPARTGVSLGDGRERSREGRAMGERDRGQINFPSCAGCKPYMLESRRIPRKNVQTTIHKDTVGILKTLHVSLPRSKTTSRSSTNTFSWPQWPGRGSFTIRSLITRNTRHNTKLLASARVNLCNHWNPTHRTAETPCRLCPNLPSCHHRVLPLLTTTA